jgi:glycosyltransferase involved in cell wall biosynthesis
MVTLINAFAIVRKLNLSRLLILGDGPERFSLEALVRGLNLEHCVRMPGFVANPFPMIKSARIFASASLAEGCPNVIQQALACGTQIVATDSPGGTSEILENGRWGRLVPVADPESMAAAILASLDDPNPPDGRIRAADFTPEKTTRAYLDVLVPGFNPRQVPGLPEE